MVIMRRIGLLCSVWCCSSCCLHSLISAWAPAERKAVLGGRAASRRAPLKTMHEEVYKIYKLQ